MKQTSFGSNTLFSKFKCPPKSPPYASLVGSRKLSLQEMPPPMK